MRVWRYPRSGRRAMNRDEDDPSVAVGRRQGFFLRQEAPDHHITWRRTALRGSQRQQLPPQAARTSAPATSSATSKGAPPTLPERPTTSGDKMPNPVKAALS